MERCLCSERFRKSEEGKWQMKEGPEIALASAASARGSLFSGATQPIPSSANHHTTGIWHGYFFIVGDILNIVGYLAAIQGPTHWITVDISASGL